MADHSDDDNCNEENGHVAFNIYGNAADCGGTVSRFSAAEEAACGSLMRAEYNLGMALVEQKMFREATPHLSAVGDGFKKMVKGNSATPGRGKEEERSTSDVAEPFFSSSVWKAALIERPEGMSDLGGLYALSLALLGECFASASPSRLSSSSLAEIRGTAAAPREGDAAAAAAAAQSTILPLGTSVAPRGDRLATAVETLEASVEAFLSVEDPAGAVDALERLVRILRLFNGGEERYYMRAKTLCDRASSVAALCSSGGGQGCGADGSAGGGEAGSGAVHNDDDNLEEEIDQVRENIKALHARLGGSGSDGGRAGCGQDSVSRRRLEVGEGEGRGGGGGGGRECVASKVLGYDSQQGHRVGPLPTAGFAQRRRRLSAKTSASTSRGTGHRRSNIGEVGSLSKLPDTGAHRGDSDSLSAGVPAFDIAAGVLMRGGGNGLGGRGPGSFSRLRAAAMAAANEVALNVEGAGVASGGDVGEDTRKMGVGTGEGERTAFAAYRDTVRWKRL